MPRIPKEGRGAAGHRRRELDVVVSILSGLVNKTLVMRRFVSGLSGADGTLLGQFHEAVESTSASSAASWVRPTLLSAVLGAGFLQSPRCQKRRLRRLGPRGALGAKSCRYRRRARRVTGGMKPKLRSAVEALEAGVSEVIIAGPSMHRSALLEGKGGTHLVAA
jgi:acetylglutamate kinase